MGKESANLQGHRIWQKSFATEVNATIPGYNLAALAIFAVPWALGTVIGLVARVIRTDPIFPTYPHPFTGSEALSGFVMPYTIKALMGSGGVVAFFLLFMTLTSTVSSSMIAVSSILSFDLYKTYLDPKAIDKRLVRVSQSSTCVSMPFHIWFLARAELRLREHELARLFYSHSDCPGIIPLILTLPWSRQTRLAVIPSPVLGLVTGLTV